jgi:hypothetical protein
MKTIWALWAWKVICLKQERKEEKRVKGNRKALKKTIYITPIKKIDINKSGF